jgi:hypothetical protein
MIVDLHFQYQRGLNLVNVKVFDINHNVLLVALVAKFNQ